MLNDDLEIYDSCDLEKPLIPPRSRFYHLEPIGIGTPYVESLTSYIARLAEAHCLTPIHLLKHAKDPLSNKFFQQKNLFGMKHNTGEVNGRGKTALQLVNILEKVTLRKDLKFLTLLIWSEVFPQKKLIKTTRHWCPLCYQKNLLNNLPIYEPLLWSLTVVEICPLHKILLENFCDYCYRELPPLATNFRIGFCSKCGKWLGKSTQTKNKKLNISQEKIKWQNYVINNIEKIILTSFDLPQIISRNAISKSLNLYIDHITEGNVAAFARMIGFPKNTVWMWSKGKSIPQINILLQICYLLDLSILEFIKTDKLEANYPKTLKRNNILVNNIKENSNSRSTIDEGCIKQYLRQSIVNKATPPCSITEISKQLGYDRRVLIRKFPELCKAISKKYLEYKKNISLNKIDRYCCEVEVIANKLHSQGIYPSEITVSKFLDKPGYFRYKKVRNTLKEFLDTI